MAPRTVLASVLVAAATLSAGLAAQQAGSVPADFADVTALAQTDLTEINASGAAIAIVKGDRIVYQKGVGVANVETGQAMSPDMLFRVGSVTKMFTTAAPGVLEIENRVPAAVREALTARGHKLRVLEPYGMSTGVIAVGVDPQSGTLRGGVDLRRERYVFGW